MGFISYFFDEIKIANSCYMGAAIEFNYAMFHIFSGPLFANLEGYVFLDLLIWGISPLIFQIFRGTIKKHIQPNMNNGFQYRKQTIIKRRFFWFVSCFMAILASYVFMNYSPSFRWNYFSRVVNLDFGYLLFDLAFRCMELLVEVEEYQQHRALIYEQRGTLQPIFHSAGYCKYRNIFMMASYFLVFYLSTVYGQDNVDSGINIFKKLSILSCMITFCIPILYLLKHRNNSYGFIGQSQGELEIEEVQTQNSSQVNKVYFAFCLVSFSFFINMSYFSLWVMQGLKKQKDDPHLQFNKTLFISAAFFLISSFLQFVVSHLYIGCNIKQGVIQEGNRLYKFVKPFVLLYGVLILAMFGLASDMEWRYMVVPIIPFGLHYILVNYYVEAVCILKEEDPTRFSYQKLFFYCQITAYLIIPTAFTILGIADDAFFIFGVISGGSLILSAFYM